ncbi:MULTISPECIES: flagellar hook protein FlgE [unclassified Sulfitobacter]|uniref:flagellar hook protein FlgE n=3 Tax=Sulfitobacter TaxID=60136 RepID=UPI0007C22A84|nr:MULTISPECIES: flagellar hook-basal body complex protein [unclassified Sulfitobacter]KZX97961.1 flagellar hook protein [Sulfitobacter sp. HI0023]KZY27093.1 flagellar hook protein [Sulfitobacter sp. HI0040]
MSISYAMQTGVSGLRANSTAVGRISENIANANTDGYRRSFVQMVTTSTLSQNGTVAPSGVRAVQGSEISTEGALRATDQATDLAIGGPGFFVVSKQPNETNEANFMLTRAGSFLPDENGNLRNAAGYYLAGFPYDQTASLGMIDRNQFGDLKTVNLGSLSQTGSPTGAMTISGNIPAQQTGLATPGEPFLSSAEYFSPLGAAQRMQFSWQPGAVDDQWTLSFNGADGTQYGNVTVDFHDSGPLAGAPRQYSNATTTANPPANFAFNAGTGVAALTINNGAVPQNLAINIGAPGTYAGMTQFAGDYSPLKITADGAESGVLVRTEIDERGDVYGVFDNGSRKPLYNIPLAEVANPDGLLKADGNAFLLSRSSGKFSLNQAGEGSTGSLTAGALESSNVEVAQELTDLISTQRAYSSNAKIVTTVDEMLDETTRLKR